MRPHWRLGIWLITAPLTVAGVGVLHAEQPAIQCGPPRIEASFTAALSSYHVTTSCSAVPAGFVNWDSRGSYDSHTGLAREEVHVYLPQGFSATATTTVTCPSDPWLGPAVGAGKVACANGSFNTSGQAQDARARFWLDWLRDGFSGSALPNSTGFSYNRPPLIAQRDAALKTETDAAAALQKHNQQILGAARQGPAVVAPVIVLPAANASFLENTTISVKLLPPAGIQVTSFMVRLERRDSQGNWAVFNNLPVNVAEATSPTGYTGWGAPGTGKGPAMIAGRGSYRVSAQVLSPKPTRWSAPVEFTVTSLNKAIQPGPKAFSPGVVR